MQEEHRENFFTELLKFLLIAAVIVIPIRLFVAQPFFVSGSSMYPTFQNGQYLIVDEISYDFEQPQRGDIIIFRYPRDPSEFFIKRIVGLPGDTVYIYPNSVTVQDPDGKTYALAENYVVNKGNGPDQVYHVPADSYFVMGDNRPASSDSRSWGFVPRQNIVGQAFLRLLPIGQASLFPGSVTEAQ